MTTDNDFEVFGLKPGASKEDVRRAYLRCIRKIVADRDGHFRDDERRRLDLAYERLCMAKTSSVHVGQSGYGEEADYFQRIREKVLLYVSRLVGKISFRDLLMALVFAVKDRVIPFLLDCIGYVWRRIPWFRLYAFARSHVKLLMIIAMVFGGFVLLKDARVAGSGTKGPRSGRMSVVEYGEQGEVAVDASSWEPETQLIGNWMSEDLSVTVYRNGDYVFHARSKKDWRAANEAKVGAWCYYENGRDRGVLYNWYAITDQRGLAPIGWHIPGLREWSAFVDHGDVSVFDMAHGGFRKSGGGYSHHGRRACFWIAPEDGSPLGMALDLKKKKWTREGDIVDISGDGYSVRCVSD